MKHSPHKIGHLGDLTGYDFRRTWAAIRKHFEQSTAGLGITQVSFGVLSVIEANPGIRQSEVGKLLEIKSANMANLIGELSSSGLVNRATDPDDRRAISLTLSEKGVETMRHSLARIREHEEVMLADLDPADLALLAKVLKQIRVNCEAC